MPQSWALQPSINRVLQRQGKELGKEILVFIPAFLYFSGADISDLSLCHIAQPSGLGFFKSMVMELTQWTPNKLKEACIKATDSVKNLSNELNKAFPDGIIKGEKDIYSDED